MRVSTTRSPSACSRTSPPRRRDEADLTITLTRAQLLGLLGGAGTDGIEFDGDRDVLTTVLDLTDQPVAGFRIVRP
ncbi:alkyl sulfatase C-terminal domain-containing protein [Actinomycetospora lemnae]|uniref:Alkyl sulfatase C-terminal domain-containing protein n=1 Tax=Actinomycetospora lemnae TaxID=3019891 RepID=A0ABT5SRF2_9PSEU|nr:alkyl sulfatase C-terminal domain-containing protein [Actinomycetospora sp. DW7H6]MDD7965359.1 alkyl sulfatase C-terminal domain-containing protein [Actinomycetospora sp. DW7H6]